MEPPSKSNLITSIRGALKTICSYNASSLTDESDGIVGFMHRQSAILKILENSHLLFDSFDKNYPIFFEQSASTLEKTYEALSALGKTLGSMKRFIDKQNSQIGLSPNDDDFQFVDNNMRRNELITEFDTVHNNFDNNVIHIINDINRKKIEEKDNQIEEQSRRISELSLVQEKQALTLYAKHIDKRILDHKSTAECWLLLLFIIIFLAVAFIVFEFCGFNREEKRFFDTLSFLEFSSLRIFAFFLFGYGMHFTSKGYRLNKNQQIIYEDKKAALESYDSFDKSSKFTDPALHHLILAQVTNAIFVTPANGYVDDAKEPSVSMLNISEGFKTLSKNTT